MVLMSDSSPVSSMIVRFGRVFGLYLGRSGKIRTPARRAHFTCGRLRSASMPETLAPCRARQVISILAVVDFPTPPLGDATTMVGMISPIFPMRYTDD